MENRKFGYIRVSSKDQNEGRQLEVMRKMAKKSVRKRVK